MKHRFCLFAAIVTVIWLCLPIVATAQQPSELEVARAVICRTVVDREPVDPGTTFTVLEGKLYCFTQIVGAQDPVAIAHVWHFADTERARVELPVRGMRWRTFSSKIIQDHEIGQWRVDVLGPGDEVLHVLYFEVTP
jgi:hypothetical protein